MSLFGQGISRQRFLQIAGTLQVENYAGNNLLYVTREDDTVDIDDAETNIEGKIKFGDRLFPINQDQESGSCYFIFNNQTGSQ